MSLLGVVFVGVLAGVLLIADRDVLPEAGEEMAPTSLAADAPGAMSPQEALDGLDEVTIEGPQNVDYDRVGQFGESWQLDLGDTGCDARNEVLVRDLTDVVHDDDGCIVLAGTLDEPYGAPPDDAGYTGTIEFERGLETSHLVQIDHIVPLAWSARQGALDWEAQQREEFANDSVNLIAVYGPTNQDKGDAGLGEWLPYKEEFHCDYVAAFVSVVLTYDLDMPATDAQVAESILTEC